MTQPDRSFGKKRSPIAPPRLWRPVRLIAPAMVLLLVLTACYQDVAPTPTPNQISAPSGDSKSKNEPPQPPSKKDTGGGGGGGGTPTSVAKSPPAPGSKTPSPTPRVGPPPRLTVTPTVKRPAAPTKSSGGGKAAQNDNNATAPTAVVKPPAVVKTATTAPTAVAKPPTAVKTATTVPTAPSAPSAPPTATTTAPQAPTVSTFVASSSDPGGITITKQDPEQAPVVGACFALLDEQETAVVTVCDQGDGDNDSTPGTIQINGVAPGEYTLRETFAPDGYLAVSDQPVSVVAGESTVQQIIDEFDTTNGAIVITKVDTDGLPVEGVCFGVLSSSTPVTTTCDDDGSDADPQSGIIQIELAPGTYSVAETPPAGYLPSEPIDVTVNRGEFTPLEIVNELEQIIPTSTVEQTGSIAIHVRDENDQPLGGSCFAIQSSDISPQQLCDDDGDGELSVVNLPLGKYDIQQSAPPEGFIAADVQTIAIEAGSSVDVWFVNQTAPTPTATAVPLGSLLVVVTDDQGQSLTGACFSLTPRSGTPGEKQSLCDADDGSDDGFVTFTDLAPGTWRLREYQPPENYPEPDSVDVEIYADETTQAQMINIAEPTEGSIQITKLDDQNQLLGGTCFDLIGEQSFRVCDNDQYDADGTEGIISIQALPPDDYQVTESQIPDGFAPAPDQMVTIVAGNEPATLTFINQPMSEPEEPSVIVGGSTDGISLSQPAVYQDDWGHLWLLQPGDDTPTRLDDDNHPFDPLVNPTFSAAESWLAFFVRNDENPTSNLTLYDVRGRQLVGQIPFDSVGTPVHIAWLPGSDDTLAVAVQSPSDGTTNVYIYGIGAAELSAVFDESNKPSWIDGLYPAPAGSLLAIQTIGTDGDADVFLYDTQGDPTPISVGPNNGDDPDQFVAWSPGGYQLLIQSGYSGQPFVTDMSAGAIPLPTSEMFLGDSASGTKPAWSADGSWLAYFDTDPSAGGQLQMVTPNGGGCSAIPNVVSFGWSPIQSVLDILLRGDDGRMYLNEISLDCSQTTLTAFDDQPYKLSWSPTGRALAVVADSGVWQVLGDTPYPLDNSSIAYADILGWSSNGDVLALFAGGPPAMIWVAPVGDSQPVPISGSTLPENASYVTAIWWP